MYCASRHISALSGKKNNRLFHDSILKIKDKTAENKPGILKNLYCNPWYIPTLSEKNIKRF
jgi:hypothetical protein